MGSTIETECQDTCMICLAPISLRAVAVPCNHLTFDYTCLLTWLQEQPTCPLCKSQLTAIQYDWRSPEDFKTWNIPNKHKHRDQNYANIPTSSPGFADSSRPRTLASVRRPYSPPIRDLALEKRRKIYQKKLYSQHVGSNPFSGYCDITPQIIANSPDLQARARSWIRRELRVFTFLRQNSGDSTRGGATATGNVEFLLSYIVSILKIVDLKASHGHAENLLTEFLGRDNASLFLHELAAWLKSPYDKLEQWDRNVQYAEDA